MSWEAQSEPSKLGGLCCTVGAGCEQYALGSNQWVDSDQVAGWILHLFCQKSQLSSDLRPEEEGELGSCHLQRTANGLQRLCWVGNNCAESAVSWKHLKYARPKEISLINPRLNVRSTKMIHPLKERHSLSKPPKVCEQLRRRIPVCRRKSWNPVGMLKAVS